MTDPKINARRSALKTISLGLASIPLLSISNAAIAAPSPLRAALGYQDKPKGTQKCSNCMHFVAGKTAKDNGGCKLMAGDDGISPEAWCTAWVELKKG
jgi:High potential iron-sulfur protein